MAALVAALMAVVTVGACKPDRVDVVEARRQQAKDKAERARVAVRADDSAELHKGGSTLPKEVAELEVARIGDRVILLGDVAARIAAQPRHMRQRYRDLNKKVELVESLVQFELLADAALDKKLDTAPEVQLAWKQAMVETLLERVGAQRVSMSELTDAELRAYYDSHQAELTRPEMRRAAVVVLFEEVKARQVATTLRDQIAAAPEEARALFVEAVTAHSADTDTKDKGGDLGWFDAKGLNELGQRRVPDKVVTVAYGLGEPGVVSEPLYMGQGMYYIVQLTELRPAEVPPLADVRLDIQTRLLKQRAAIEKQRYIDEVVAKAQVEIDQGQLAKLAVVAPAAPASGAPEEGADGSDKDDATLKRLRTRARKQLLSGPHTGAAVRPLSQTESVRAHPDALKKMAKDMYPGVDSDKSPDSSPAPQETPK